MERATGTHTVAFLLVENFTLSPFTLAVDTLRLANYVSGRPIFAWKLYSADGVSAVSSCGIRVAVDAAFADLGPMPEVVVCAGIGVESMDHGELIGRLRQLAFYGASLASVCLGTFVLADAGLLDGYRCTTHWEYIAGLRERHPQLEVTEELFEVDRKRSTCAGGTAAIDLMLDMIARREGAKLANEVTDELIHHRMRGAGEAQRRELRARVGVANQKVLDAVALMEKHLEDTLSCAQLAREVGLSPRQLERLFGYHLGTSPARYYMGLRLERSRQLLRQTTLPVLEVALASGFSAASHFSKNYSGHFGRAPTEERGLRGRSHAQVGIRQETDASLPAEQAAAR